jgi:EAL domain-containing protein (putative c-di-GMP-specific phosphodiesterase class I)
MLQFFDSYMQEAINARATLQEELNKALVKQQFHLYYQIQVNELKRPIGAEALIRWSHPERGLVSPDDFIPLAEDSGSIVSIGTWVLRTACDQLKSWQAHAITRHLTLAVNVSAKQFHQPDFVSQVTRIIQESGARPAQLKLELTESMLLEDVDSIIAKMNELKLLGVHFSMDDFGTGYSSLQYIKRLPLDQLKIDQSFVRDINADANSTAIVKTVVAMSQALGLEVIAEGVETEEQKTFLDKNGCHTFQGYLFGKPVPVDQFEMLLQSYD